MPPPRAQHPAVAATARLRRRAARDRRRRSRALEPLSVVAPGKRLVAQRELQAVVGRLQAGVLQRAFELVGVAAQHVERLRLLDHQPRRDLAAAIDIEPHVDAAELRRIETDLEAVASGLRARRDLDREAFDRHRRGRQRIGGVGALRACAAAATGLAEVTPGLQMRELAAVRRGVRGWTKSLTGAGVSADVRSRPAHAAAADGGDGVSRVLRLLRRGAWFRRALRRRWRAPALRSRSSSDGCGSVGGLRRRRRLGRCGLALRHRRRRRRRCGGAASAPAAALAVLRRGAAAALAARPARSRRRRHRRHGRDFAGGGGCGDPGRAAELRPCRDQSMRRQPGSPQPPATACRARPVARAMAVSRPSRPARRRSRRPSLVGSVAVAVSRLSAPARGHGGRLAGGGNLELLGGRRSSRFSVAVVRRRAGLRRGIGGRRPRRRSADAPRRCGSSAARQCCAAVAAWAAACRWSRLADWCPRRRGGRGRSSAQQDRKRRRRCLGSPMRSRWVRPGCCGFRTLALDATCGTGAPLDTESASDRRCNPRAMPRNFEKLPKFQELVIRSGGRQDGGRDRHDLLAGGKNCPTCGATDAIRRGNPYNKGAPQMAYRPMTMKERGAAAAQDAQFARSRGTARGHARGRRDVGRRRFLGDGGAAEGRGLRRRRRHAAALRPWRGDPPQGRLLRRPGHPRRPRGRRAGSAFRITCSTTRAASRRR